jgi:hypothetical protein
MALPTDQYHFEALPESSIRLIEFLPDSQPQSIKCRLLVYPTEKCPPYTALSYMWGPEHPQKSITVDGSTHQIRENLACFLDMMTKKRLEKKWNRKKTSHSLFWIDQICIDQSNIQERNHQVKRMRDIYSNAHLVTIWLGPASPASDAAMKSLAGYRVSIMAKFNPAQNLHLLLRLSLYHVLASLYQVCVPAPIILKAFRTLQDFPYWSRVWILQEVICARDCVLSCGNMSIPWKNLVQYDALRVSHPSSGHKMFLPNIIRRSLSYSNGERGWDLQWLLMDFHASECTDPRDRIFAVLGLLHKNTTKVDTLPIMEPDYNKTNFEVYEDAIRYFQTGIEKGIGIDARLRLKFVIMLLRVLEVQLSPENYLNTAKFLQLSDRDEPLPFCGLLCALADGRKEIEASPDWPWRLAAWKERDDQFKTICSAIMSEVEKKFKSFQPDYLIQ